jgi:hypothetical protein
VVSILLLQTSTSSWLLESPKELYVCPNNGSALVTTRLIWNEVKPRHYLFCGLTLSTGETINSYIYPTVHKVNAVITFETVTAGDRMCINLPNKPIKNELLQLTNPPHNNKNHNWVNTWFFSKIKFESLNLIVLSNCCHFYSLTVVLNLHLINRVWLTTNGGTAVILWHVVTGPYMSSTVGFTSCYIHNNWHKLY